MEKFLRWRHEHYIEVSENTVHPIGYVSLFADTLHNFVDGVLIGASYLVSLPLGISVTIAIVLHEIPQEIGDFGVLLHAGFSKRKALLVNSLSAVAAIVGMILALIIGCEVDGLSGFIVPFAAGGFVYLAGSDLVPELHKENTIAKSLIQFTFILLGICLLFLLTFLE